MSRAGANSPKIGPDLGIATDFVPPPSVIAGFADALAVTALGTGSAAAPERPRLI